MFCFDIVGFFIKKGKYKYILLICSYKKSLYFKEFCCLFDDTATSENFILTLYNIT